MTGKLGIGTIMIHATKSSVPTYPNQIVFVIGISTPRNRQTGKGDVALVMNYNVIKQADMTDVITRVVDTSRYV